MNNKTKWNSVAQYLATWRRSPTPTSTFEHRRLPSYLLYKHLAEESSSCGGRQVARVAWVIVVIIAGSVSGELRQRQLRWTLNHILYCSWKLWMEEPSHNCDLLATWRLQEFHFFPLFHSATSYEPRIVGWSKKNIREKKIPSTAGGSLSQFWGKDCIHYLRGSK